MAGDRSMAARLARVARSVFPGLRLLRSAVHVVVPCPVPDMLLQLLQTDLRKCLHLLPGGLRRPQHTISVRTCSVGWGKSSFADCVLAAALPDLDAIGCCSCQGLVGPRHAGHLITRDWQSVPCAAPLASVCGEQSLAQRTYPGVHFLLKTTEDRVRRVLRAAGYPTDSLEEVSRGVLRRFSSGVTHWLRGLPPYLVRSHIRRGLRPVHSAGFLFVRIDRSPGRVMLLCREAWLALQRLAFLLSPRYCPVPGEPNEEAFVEEAETSLREVLRSTGSRLRIRRGPNAGMPYAYFTLKNKSTLASTAPVVKVRPIIAHACHPCRSILTLGGRALSLIVEVATTAVQQKYPAHTAMWKLHHGSLQWVTKLQQRPDIGCCAEFDVEDCFLNTPREMVLQAFEFWVGLSLSRTRQQPWFALAKDGKAADHRGRSCSLHYWELSAQQLRSLVVWELECNASFQVVSEAGRLALEQRRGLPIGGHFSAALVELVALWREYTQPWPRSLAGCPTARYRDNYFVALPDVSLGRVAVHDMASQLSELLAMPVKFEQLGAVVRCLELRLAFGVGRPVHVTVAFRTDADRQGEAGNVTAWPGRWDPRTPRVLPGLLAGLAAKLRQYRAPGTGGYTAAIRRATAFVKAKGYPSRWWVRRFALSLLRQGVPAGCLPPLLRGAVSPFPYPRATGGPPPALEDSTSAQCMQGKAGGHAGQHGDESEHAR